MSKVQKNECPYDGFIACHDLETLNTFISGRVSWMLKEYCYIQITEKFSVHISFDELFYESDPPRTEISLDELIDNHIIVFGAEENIALSKKMRELADRLELAAHNQKQVDG